MRELSSRFDKNRVEIKLNISKSEVYRYLGYNTDSKVDEETDRLIDECINELLDIARKNYAYSFYDISIEDNVSLNDTKLNLSGEDIKKHLNGCGKCAILSVTLGLEVDRRIRLYNSTNLTKAIILDACASTGVEALCDVVHSMVKRIANNNDYNITSRYSPGYGDFSLDHQRGILQLMDGPAIGLSCTDDNILVPRKSVTAIIGIGDNIDNVEHTCDKCSLKDNCLFKKGGDTCVNNR